MTNGDSKRLKAIIYLLATAEQDRWARVCMDWCERHSYELVGVVVETDLVKGGKWASVVQMLADGSTNVCVVPRWDHMPPERVPRVEVIAEDVARDAGAPERPRIIGM